MPRAQQPSSNLLGTILAAIFLIVLAGSFFAFQGIHQVPEGHIGVYWFGGALQNYTTEPGFHFKVPILTKHDFVQFTIQTDTVKDVPCGTAGGAMIFFDKIEVVNRLNKEFAHSTIKQYGPEYDKTWIFDKIHHEINQFCSSHTLQEVYITEFERLDEELAKALQRDCDAWKTGIEVIAIRVTKPQIPDSVRKNYENVEEQKTQLMVATQAQLVIQKQEETMQIQSRMLAEREAEATIINANREAQVAMIEAKKQFDISRIATEQHILEKQGQLAIQEIESQIYLSREKAKTDAECYKIAEEAKAMTQKLTPEFLQYTLFTNLANSTKFYFGENIPSMFLPFLQSGNSP